MQKWKIILVSAFSVLAACGCEPAGEIEPEGATGAPEFSVSESGVKLKNVEGFGGVIAESYQDSQERWAEEELPNEDAPNVIIFLLDDVGFAQVGTFGALIDTPTIDRLADNFNADLDRVLITVPDENTVPPRQLPATYY